MHGSRSADPQGTPPQSEEAEAEVEVLVVAVELRVEDLRVRQGRLA